MASTRTWARAACAAGLAVIAGLATGCSAGSASNTTAGTSRSLPASFGPPEKITLNVAVVPAMDSAGFFIALREGLFAREGLKIKYTPAVSSETAVAQQLKGQLDITGGNYVSYIQLAAQSHAPIEVVSEGSIMQPGSQVVFTMPGSKIKTLAGLKGRLLGVNAPKNIDYLLDVSVLEENGISPGQVNFPTAANPAFAAAGGAVPFPEMAADLAAGKIDAATMPEPFASQAEQKYGAVPIADLNQGATTDFPIEGYVVTKAWAARNPNTLRRFLAALSAGQAIADTSRVAVEKAFKSLNGPQNGQVSPGIASVMALNTYPIGIDKTRIQRVSDVMYQFHLLPRRFNVSGMLLPPSFFDFSGFSAAGRLSPAIWPGRVRQVRRLPPAACRFEQYPMSPPR